MRVDLYALQAKRLIDRIESLEVCGEVVGKRERTSAKGRPLGKILVIRFKDRELEKPVGDTQFEQTKLGDRVQFTPPIPERDSCLGHLCLCIAVGIAVGIFALWKIATYFSGRTGFTISLIVGAWISVIVWAVICTHERRKYLKDLKAELLFFENGNGVIPRGSDNLKKTPKS